MDFKEMKEVVRNDEHFKRWVHGVETGTQKNYLTSLSGFCLAVGKTPTELLEICKEDYSKPPWERAIGKWFIEFDTFAIHKEWSLDTFRKKKTNVKGFFRFYQIEVPPSRRGQSKNFKNANERELPTKEELIQLLNATNSLKEKAIILTQFSSGLSNIDVVKLTVGQFYNGVDENDICKIKTRRRKNGNEFVTFISPEAVKVIKSYLQVEREDLQDTQPLFTKFKTLNEPLQTVAIVHTYARLNDALGWGKGDNAWRKVTGHIGRKWLKTNLANAGMPREPLETFLGHKLRNGTDDNYYIMHEEQLKSIYMKYLPHITIDPVETYTLESEEYQSLKEENISLKEQLEQQNIQHKTEIAELTARLESVEQVKDKVDKLEYNWIKKFTPKGIKPIDEEDFKNIESGMRTTETIQKIIHENDRK